MAAPLPLPAIHATHAGVWIAEGSGEVREAGRGEAIARAADTPHLLLNAPVVGQRLGYPGLAGLDLLELFAFVHPARFAVPTIAGLGRVLDLDPPAGEADSASALRRIAERLLDTLGDQDWAEREGAWTSNATLQRLGWGWAGLVAARLDPPERGERALFSRLPQWDESALRPPPRTVTVSVEEAEARVDELTGRGAETRVGQRAMAAAATDIFLPRRKPGEPRMLLAEAGTGIGKTLAYLAPASLWADRAGGTVWVSTFTKALQRQLDAEGARLFADPVERRRRIVVRKGRENYLCLLNLEDAMQGAFSGRAAILAHLAGRWAAYTRDGDMVGGDLPGWLPSLFRRAGATALTDRRGECIYAGCPHFRRCFIERSERAGREADLVIANHALVMVNAARGRDVHSPERIVFDEGHHLFDAADSTFAITLGGGEAIELRRWIVGPEGRSRGRRRGLAARLSDVVSYDAQGAAALDAAIEAAGALPSDGWPTRLVEGAPWGPLEALLGAVRGTVYARAKAQDSGYGLETELAEPDADLIAAAAAALSALEALHRPLTALGRRLEAVLEDAPDWLDAQARARIDGAIGGIGWRTATLAAWIGLLGRIGGSADPEFVDWLAVERIEGREHDVAIHRRWLDPTRPLAATVLANAHGVMVTSATLRAGEDWPSAEARTGAAHLAGVQHFEAPSPFDYPRVVEVLIVNDLPRGDTASLAGAYARLIEAAGGGTLGLFTAIDRLRAVHARIADRLARAGLALHAQHVDPIDTGTLVDIFRDDPRSSLLGTDALRDGVDVPGESLRLVVMERVPWPRPTVLHAARRMAHGGRAYDERVVRARLAQAFGRLIRREGDRGVFVILSSAMPSRLLGAFPPGVAVRRLPLDEAIARVTEHLSAPAAVAEPAVT